MKVRQECAGCGKKYLVDTKLLLEDTLYSYCPKCRAVLRSAGLKGRTKEQRSEDKVRDIH